MICAEMAATMQTDNSDNPADDEIHDGDAGGADNDNVSVADSEFMDLQDDIAKLHANREAFLAQHWGLANTAGAGLISRRGRPRGRRRGPRKPPEPPAEIKLRINRAHELFIKEQYDEALDILFGIVRQNAEIHSAWILMASIFQDSGDRENEMLARVFAAHLFPRDVSGWMAAADIALADAEAAAEHERPIDESDSEDGERVRRMQRLQIARICYSGAIAADQDCIPARLGKGNVCLEFEQPGPAAIEYQRVLRRRPYNMEAVRNLAEVSYDTNRREDTIRSAISAYQGAIAHAHAGGELDDDATFEWADVSMYCELHAVLGEHELALLSLKSLVRWILGRKEERFWDLYRDDDREWDRDDHRRKETSDFQPGRYPLESYGLALPIDLRAKLAVYRLKLGYEDEALVGPFPSFSLCGLLPTPF